MGLTERDSEGFRLRPDGQRLTLVNSTFTPWPAENVEMQELIKDYLKEVGIEIIVNPTEQRLWVPYVHGLSHDIASYASNLGFAGNPPVLRETFCTAEGNQHWAPQWGLWYATGGEEGEEPPEEIKQLQGLYEQILGETRPIGVTNCRSRPCSSMPRTSGRSACWPNPTRRYGVCRTTSATCPRMAIPPSRRRSTPRPSSSSRASSTSERATRGPLPIRH